MEKHGIVKVPNPLCIKQIAVENTTKPISRTKRTNKSKFKWQLEWTFSRSQLMLAKNKSCFPLLDSGPCKWILLFWHLKEYHSNLSVNQPLYQPLIPQCCGNMLPFKHLDHYGCDAHNHQIHPSTSKVANLYDPMTSLVKTIHHTNAKLLLSGLW